MPVFVATLNYCYYRTFFLFSFFFFSDDSLFSFDDLSFLEDLVVVLRVTTSSSSSSSPSSDCSSKQILCYVRMHFAQAGMGIEADVDLEAAAIEGQGGEEGGREGIVEVELAHVAVKRRKESVCGSEEKEVKEIGGRGRGRGKAQEEEGQEEQVYTDEDDNSPLLPESRLHENLVTRNAHAHAQAHTYSFIQ